jgi:hypothetical protein
LLMGKYACAIFIGDCVLVVAYRCCGGPQKYPHYATTNTQSPMNMAHAYFPISNSDRQFPMNPSLRIRR